MTSVRVVAATLLAAGALLATLAGCDPPIHPPMAAPSVSPSPSVSARPSVRPSLSRPASRSPSPSSTGTEGPAVSCAGRPGAEQVLALLRSQRLVQPQTDVVAVRTGPLCVGNWQYTVVARAQREPLQVVTRGPATALTLVTAGTDVCTWQVKAYAPPGLLAVARCRD